MTTHTIYLYDYVPVPFERVRAMLATDAAHLIGEAVDAAGARAETIAAKLEVSIAGFEVGRTIDVRLGDLTESDEGMASVRLHLTWEASHRSGFFPLMEGDLEAMPLTEDETEIVLAGVYRPPFGPAGSALDAALFHRLADASVRQFFGRIVRRISAERWLGI